MREYDENHAYEEVREDFIKEYKAQLERRLTLRIPSDIAFWKSASVIPLPP